MDFVQTWCIEKIDGLISDVLWLQGGCTRLRSS
jgi:hypothetical protein